VSRREAPRERKEDLSSPTFQIVPPVTPPPTQFAALCAASVDASGDPSLLYGALNWYLWENNPPGNPGGAEGATIYLQNAGCSDIPLWLSIVETLKAGLISAVPVHEDQHSVILLIANNTSDPINVPSSVGSLLWCDNGTVVTAPSQAIGTGQVGLYVPWNDAYLAGTEGAVLINLAGASSPNAGIGWNNPHNGTNGCWMANTVANQTAEQWYEQYMSTGGAATVTFNSTYASITGNAAITGTSGPLFVQYVSYRNL